MHHTNDDTEMATIRRSGSGWQVLIRRKNYVGPRSRTFLSRDLAQSWADAIEERTKKFKITKYKRIRAEIRALYFLLKYFTSLGKGEVLSSGHGEGIAQKN